MAGLEKESLFCTRSTFILQLLFLNFFQYEIDESQTSLKEFFNRKIKNITSKEKDFKDEYVWLLENGNVNYEEKYLW
mgnify:CR=1 FL=1